MNTEWPNHPFRMYLLGKTGTGKTTLAVKLLLEHWLRQFLYFDVITRKPRYNIFILCPTFQDQVLAGPTKAYYRLWEFISPENVYLSADAESLQMILQKVKHAQQCKENSLVWIDDVTGTGILSGKAGTNSPLGQFVTTLSHMNCSLVLMWHILSAASRTIRESVGHVVIFQPTSTVEARQLHNEFGGPLNSQQFVDMIFENTDNRGQYLHVSAVPGEYKIWNHKGKVIFPVRTKRKNHASSKTPHGYLSVEQ